MTTTTTTQFCAQRPGEATLEDLARLRREDPGVPLGSPETTTLERARSHVLALIRATREQLLPEARRMATEHPHPTYEEEVVRLGELVRDDARRALVLGVPVRRVADVAGYIDTYALRKELVERGLLPHCDAHLA